MSNPYQRGVFATFGSGIARRRAAAEGRRWPVAAVAARAAILLLYNGAWRLAIFWRMKWHNVHCRHLMLVSMLLAKMKYGRARPKSKRCCAALLLLLAAA